MLPLLGLFAVLSATSAGLLRVPKVYNAVITSNQNLSPSRAFPVIQPVIHRTAIGYVPPLYYTQVVPNYANREVLHATATARKSDKDADQEAKQANEEKREKVANESIEKTEGRKKGDDQLSFYPNYHSLYYDPYIYTYNGYTAHFAPGSYYVDYQPYSAVAPIAPSPPKNTENSHLLPGYHEERKAKEDKVPDVPPPPLPTALPKTS